MTRAAMYEWRGVPHRLQGVGIPVGLRSVPFEGPCCSGVSAGVGLAQATGTVCVCLSG